MSEGYKATIINASETLTKKQELMLSDVTGATKLNDLVKQGEVTIVPALWAEVAIHNEKSENKDYNVYIIVDDEGNRYTTSSESFWTTFRNIADAMSDDPDEQWGIRVFTKPSKNYSGDFITCTVV